MSRAVPITVLVLVLVAVTAGAAQAADDLVLQARDVPGYKAAARGAGAGRSALGGKLPPALRKAPVKGAAFSRGRRRINVGVFTLRSSKSAATAFAQAGKGFKPVKGLGRIRVRSTRKATQAVVLVQAGATLGAVSATGPAKSTAITSATARNTAELLAARMRRDAGKTPYERTLDGIRADGTVPPAVALRAFSLAYGKLPGVTAPKGKVGEPEEGTEAMTLIARVYDKLTPAQKAAVDRALDAPAGGAAPAARTAEVLTPDPGLQTFVDKFAADYASRLPGVKAPTIIATLTDTDRVVKGMQVYADALPLNASGEWNVGKPEFCRIRLMPFGTKLIGKKQFLHLIAHETWHCFQFAMMADWRQRSDWIIEGGAVWASDQVVQSVKGDRLGAYGEYLTTPETPLFSRSYDADGFWDRTDEIMGVGSLFALMPAILNTPDDEAAFIAARGNTLAFEDQWASGAFRLGGASGPAWNQLRPLPVSFNELKPPHAVFTDDVPLASPAYAMGLYAADTNKAKPLISITSGKGRLRAGTTKGDLGIVEGTQFFCMGGKCTCPKGQTGSIPAHQDVPTIKLSLALTGGLGPGDAEVAYHGLDEYCAKEDKTPSNGGGFGDITTGPAETNGDPHLTTFDGLHFDFQAAGEFLLARSKSRDLEVQARQEPVRNSKTVTVNRQIALRVGGRRVTVSPGSGDGNGDSTPPVVRIDGAVATIAGGSSVAVGDGTVSRRTNTSGSIDVVYKDGSTVTVAPVGGFGVIASVALAESRRGQVTGLLGDFDGNPADDLGDRGGKRIAYTPVRAKGDVTRFDIKEEFDKKFFDALYDRVGDAWRISQGESLFDYGPGQSTKTFTNKALPAKPLDPVDLDKGKRAKAEQICRAAGITGSSALEDCILDVATTGDDAFAESAAEAQQAALVAWSKLGVGAGLNSPLSLAQSGDGALHVAFLDGTSLASAPVGGTQEAIGSDGEARLFTAADGSIHAAVAEIPSGRDSGVYEYARGGDGAWSLVGPITTFGSSFLDAPDALAVPGGVLIASPMAGTARVFRSGAAPGDTGVEPSAGAPGCLATSPALARDSASGEVWVAWAQSSCAQAGIFAQRVDPATGALIGAPVAAPAAGTQTTALDERLALTGRAGQAGVFLAYPDGAGAGVRVWQVGAPSATLVKKRGQANPRTVRIAADGSGGGMWALWSEDRRFEVQRLSAAGAPVGAPRPADLPADAGLALSRDVQIAARGTGLDVVLGVRGTGLYRTTFPR
jgi:hypothetical protein